MSLEGKDGAQPGTDIIVTNRGIIPLDRPERNLGERKILKNDLSTLLLWFGHRLSDFSDLDAFKRVLPSYKAFRLNTMIEAPMIQDLENDQALLKPIAQKLDGKLESTEGPLVVFVITFDDIVDRPWFDNFPQNLQRYRKMQGRNDTFVYNLMIGIGDIPYSELPEGLPGNISERFDRYELKALTLGGVYLYYNSDDLTKSSKRIVDIMNRFVGADLPGEEFPDYSLSDRAKIAWSVNREDYSLSQYDKDAPSKYPIVNGRPKFSF